MIRLPPRSPRTYTHFPYTTRCRSGEPEGRRGPRAGLGRDVQRDLGGVQDVDHRLGRHAVGEDGVDLVHMGEAHHGERDRSEENTSELQSIMRTSYAVF